MKFLSTLKASFFFFFNATRSLLCYTEHLNFAQTFINKTSSSKRTRNFLLVAHCLLVYTCCSLFFARCSLVFAYCSFLFPCCSLKFARCLIFLLAACYFLMVARYSLLCSRCSRKISEGFLFCLCSDFISVLSKSKLKNSQY